MAQAQHKLETLPFSPFSSPSSPPLCCTLHSTASCLDIGALRGDEADHVETQLLVDPESRAIDVFFTTFVAAL